MNCIEHRDVHREVRFSAKYFVIRSGKVFEIDSDTYDEQQTVDAPRTIMEQSEYLGEYSKKLIVPHDYYPWMAWNTVYSALGSVVEMKEKRHD
jgi:hypothetical protein